MAGQLGGLFIVYQENIRLGQHLLQLLRVTINPQVHGVTDYGGSAGHFPAYRQLQAGLDITQIDDAGLPVDGIDARLEALENAQLGEQGFPGAEIAGIAPAPAKGATFNLLNIAHVHVTLPEQAPTGLGVVTAYHPHQPHRREQ